MRSYEERREERREYEADCYYETWRRGLPEPDLDRVYDAYYDGVSPESLCNRMQNEQNERRRQQPEEEYYSQQEQEREVAYVTCPNCYYHGRAEEFEVSTSDEAFCPKCNEEFLIDDDNEGDEEE